MEPIIVRKAQQADIPAILEIEWECFREDSFSKEQFAYLISRSKGIFYVMMEADRVIAYVSLLFHGGTRYLRIYSIAVHPDYRGRELGQVLMDQTIQTAGECKAASESDQYFRYRAIYEKWLYSCWNKAMLLSRWFGCYLYAAIDLTISLSSHEIRFIFS